MSARWAAVVVTYESGPLLLDCVRSLIADDSAGEVEVVVVDNGSTDGSTAALAHVVPEPRIVRAPGNVGYSRGANLGIAATSAPVVAVLNADTQLERGVGGALVGRLESQPRLGAVGPRILNLDGSVYPSARIVPSVALAAAHGLLGLWWPTNPFTAKYRALDADPSQPRLVDWLSGSAIWLRRQALDDVGGWDERYFMYMEDIDLCWRLRRAGWEVGYEPSGTVEHVQGAVTRRHPYRMLLEHHRSAWRFARRRFVGSRAVLLPFAAIFLGFRCALAMAAHALRVPVNSRTRG
jgi:N-acetylglucosaminyl-diphospho-decaprenol L-rhamnosyltransferase